jgi:hypothetical protein
MSDFGGPEEQQQHNDFTFSTSYAADEYTQLLTELHESYCKDQPNDVLQYCSNFFYQKLQEQRTHYFHGSGKSHGFGMFPVVFWCKLMDIFYILTFGSEFFSLQITF